MSQAEREEAARAGGLAASRSKKRPHRFTSEEAARAARAGHKKSPGPRNPYGIGGGRKKKKRRKKKG